MANEKKKTLNSLFEQLANTAGLASHVRSRSTLAAVSESAGRDFSAAVCARAQVKACTRSLYSQTKVGRERVKSGTQRHKEPLPAAPQSWKVSEMGCLFVCVSCAAFKSHTLNVSQHVKPAARVDIYSAFLLIFFSFLTLCSPSTFLFLVCFCRVKIFQIPTFMCGLWVIQFSLIWFL